MTMIAGQRLTTSSLIAQPNNVFGCELYTKLREQEGNIFFSPTSIRGALAMAYAGAAGRTALQMADSLHFGLPAHRVDMTFSHLMEELNNPPEMRGDPAYQLVVSNALWLQRGYPFKKSFTSLVEANYGAELHEIDYSAPEPARRIINAWVEKVTNNKIKDLIPWGALTELDRLVLTNAVYFKSDWADKFSEHATKDGPFTLAGGRSVRAPLMTQWTHVEYMETGNFQLVNLPYKSHVLSMTVLLPRKADGLSALEKKLSAKALNRWIKRSRVTHVDLTLPRFTFSSQFSLKNTLCALGMTDVFDPDRADLSGMTDAEKLSLSAVLHKAFVAVDEKSTEAAAATAVAATIGAMPQCPQVVFRADRPFLFLIRHRPTGTVLFIGRLVNPAA